MGHEQRLDFLYSLYCWHHCRRVGLEGLRGRVSDTPTFGVKKESLSFLSQCDLPYQYVEVRYRSKLLESSG